MTHRQIKKGVFVIEAINGLSVWYYQYYLFYRLQSEHHFTQKQNLAAAALSGFIFIFAAWFGGRFGQRKGYLAALKTGFALLAGFLGLGAVIISARTLPAGTLPAVLDFLRGEGFQVAAEMVILAGWTVAVCFTWPNLEAVVSEGESPARLPDMIGIYNVVWAGLTAVAYFCGGALIKHLGGASIYWLPAMLYLVQGHLTARLQHAERTAEAGKNSAAGPAPAASGGHSTDPAVTRAFLRMARLANPVSYIALNTAIPLFPYLAVKFGLTQVEAGYFGSIWFFARLGAFALLWRWTGWHYHFGWLLFGFVGLMASFAVLLLAPALWMLVAAQIVFGAVVGLMYYSSLFYSMDGSETKGEHGGLHEAYIGIGLFLGPAVGAVALQVAPEQPQAGAMAVCALLGVGLVALLWLRKTKG